MKTIHDVELVSESVLVEYAEQQMRDEQKISILYHQLSQVYADTPLSQKLARFHEMESEHAVFWGV